MTTYKEIFGKPIKVLSGDPAPTPVTYTVTVANPGSGNRYYIDGVLTPTLELYEGNTYNFDYSAASSHPFRFSTASDGTHSGGSEYTTGVTVDSNITTIVVASGAPTLFYYCSSHSGMGGTALTPASPSEYEGEIWYNDSTGKFRSIVSASAWASSAPLITARSYIAGCGIQTSALAFGGSTPPYSTLTEEYNGSGWTTGGALNTARYSMAGMGTQTAALGAGGYDGPPSPGFTTLAEEYNGSSWTAGGAMTNDKAGAGGAGLQTSGLVFGGRDDTGAVATTEEYNGSSWTAGGAMGTGRSVFGSAGTQTAGLGFGGQPGDTTATEEYNGSSWTAGGNLGTALYANAGAGTQTSALSFGGNHRPPVTAQTEGYDGSSWSARPSLGTAVLQAGGAGADNTSALSYGGYTTTQTAATEEFTSSINVITGGAWSTKTNAPPIAREQGTGFGQTTNAYIHGGYFSNPTATSSGKYFEYNGTSHNAIPNTSKTIGWRSGNGSSTSGLVVGGYYYPGGSGPYANAESYNGSSWSNETAVPFAEYGFVATGATETATLMIAGDEGPTATLEYDGSSWTTSGVYPFGGYQMQMGGTQTAAVAGGGQNVPGGASTTRSDAYEYNGSSWTATGSFLQKLKLGAISGPQTAALQFGGDSYPVPSTVSYSQSYDGSVFGTAAAMGTRRKNYNSGSGTGSSTVTAGGNTGGGAYPLGTEEFSSGTESINIKNLSTS